MDIITLLFYDFDIYLLSDDEVYGKMVKQTLEYRQPGVSKHV